MTNPPQDVQAFLDTVPDRARSALLDLRHTIEAALPESEERIGYGVPAFYYKKRPLVSYGATSKHCALYVQSPEVVESFRADLSEFDLSKGTIRFQPEQPLPADLVEKLVHARIAEIDSR
jgi:uncharacterized protein YdhG (YjbR/CyaY superfamily)